MFDEDLNVGCRRGICECGFHHNCGARKELRCYIVELTSDQAEEIESKPDLEHGDSRGVVGAADAVADAWSVW